MNNTEITLTEEQDAVFQSVKAFFKQNKKNKILITGFAGTGKTTLTTKLIEWFHTEYRYRTIAVTAPTHKAVKVLKKMSATKSSFGSVKFSTLHGILGLRPVINEDGSQSFKKDLYLKPAFKNFDLVIVDEASMIEDSLFEEIVKQSTWDKKIVFVGDAEQIPPISQEFAIPFDEKRREEYDIETLSLTTIIRQASENPIIQVTSDIREGKFRAIDKSQYTKEDREGHGVYFIHAGHDIQKELMRYFVNSEFEDNSDYAKVIAWRNVTVNSFNSIIRSFIFGKNTRKILVGEKLLADAPILTDDGKEVLINTNEDITVTQLSETSQLVEGKQIKFYLARVEYDEGVDNIKILSEEGNNEKTFNDICQSLANEAKACKSADRKRTLWKKFYKVKETFASVKYNYAITAHKSQGSTYTNAFVVASDILANRNAKDCKRILYTACSRPKEKLFLI